MQYEIRDGRLHLTGYVNAVERDSKEIMTKRGRCVEQIRSGAFAKSLERNPEVRMKLNHKRTVSADMTLREDNIGLHVEADTDDEEIMALAAKGELRGWSFGFEALDDEIEQRDGRTPRRIVKDLDLSEVSVLSVTPAYNGTSLEYRSEDMCGDDSAEDVPAEETAAETEETQADDMPVDDVSEDESPVTLTDEQRTEIEQAKAYVEHLRRVGELERIRTEQRELEERYNPYHDARNGRFTTAQGGGMGGMFVVPKGGKGFYAQLNKGLSDEDIDDMYQAEMAKKQAETAPKQKPTHARNIEDMNEAQLEREIAKYERWTDSARNNYEKSKNTASQRFFDDIQRSFPGGVGGSAVNSRYRKMQERYDNDMRKRIEASEKYTNRSERLAELKSAYEKVKGTGKTLRTVATATASKGSGKWEKTTFTYLGTSYPAKKMGDYIALKPFYTYNLHDSRTGNKIRTFKTFKDLEKFVADS